MDCTKKVGSAVSSPTQKKAILFIFDVMEHRQARPATRDSQGKSDPSSFYPLTLDDHGAATSILPPISGLA